MKTDFNSHLKGDEKLKDSREVTAKPEIEKFLEDEMLEMYGGTKSQAAEEEQKSCKCIIFASA